MTSYVTALTTSRRRQLQLASTLIGAVPASLLLLFLVGEVASGEWSGVAHVLQFAPLVLLLGLGWWRPALAGTLLVGIGIVVATAYFVETRDSTVRLGEQLLVGGIFLVPPVLAGSLLLLAARSK